MYKAWNMKLQFTIITIIYTRTTNQRTHHLLFLVLRPNLPQTNTVQLHWTTNEKAPKQNLNMNNIIAHSWQPLLPIHQRTWKFKFISMYWIFTFILWFCVLNKWKISLIPPNSNNTKNWIIIRVYPTLSPL